MLFQKTTKAVFKDSVFVKWFEGRWT